MSSYVWEISDSRGSTASLAQFLETKSNIYREWWVADSNPRELWATERRPDGVLARPLASCRAFVGVDLLWSNHETPPSPPTENNQVGRAC